MISPLWVTSRRAFSTGRLRVRIASGIGVFEVRQTRPILPWDDRISVAPESVIAVEPVDSTVRVAIAGGRSITLAPIGATRIGNWQAEEVADELVERLALRG